MYYDDLNPGEHVAPVVRDLLEASMDPTGGGVGKAAGELMKEMQQAQEQLQKLQEQQGGADGASFQDSMQAQQAQQAQQVQQTQQVNQVQEIQPSKTVEGSTKAANVLLQAQQGGPVSSTTVGQAAKAQRSQMTEVVEQLVNGQDKMAGIMKMALSGKKFNSSELLAMQAGIYRFSQELEITSKVFEKATSGIKQTMNTQV